MREGGRGGREGGSKVMVGEGTRGGGREGGGGREQGDGGRVGRRERVRGGRQKARMLHRHEASVEEGREG